MKKIHTKANGYFKDLCHYSRTGWAWWQNPKAGDICIVPSCTCIPCKPPKSELPKLSEVIATGIDKQAGRV